MIQDIEKKNEDITTQFEHFNRTSNIFSIFKHEGHEDANSNMLAWLLDANEKHGLKDAFIMALIEKLNIDSTPFKTAKVYREYTFTDEDEKDKKARRIDILIKTENSTNILVIENKIYSSEHTGQLLAYMNHIKKVYGEKSAVTFVKLSPCGDLPSQDISKTRGEDGWKVLSYADILSCLLQMQQKTMPLDTRTIISNYIDYLRFSLCVDKKIMDVVKDTDVEKREEAKKQLCKDIGEVLPEKNIKTHLEKKSGVYYLRFTTPKIDTYMKDNDPTQAAQNTSKKETAFWDGHSYAFEFIITDSDLTFQLCFLEEDNKTNFKDLEDKFVYDKLEQIQPRNKTSRWIVLRKESFIFNGNNWDGLNKFISDCQEYLKRWEQEVCSKDSGIKFKPLSSSNEAYKELFDSTLEFKAKYVSNFRYYLANKIYSLLDDYLTKGKLLYFVSDEDTEGVKIKFFTSNQQNLKSEELNLRYTEGICNGGRNGNRFGEKECSTDNDEQYNACGRFWENKHHFTREIVIKDKEVSLQFVIKCSNKKEAKKQLKKIEELNKIDYKNIQLPCDDEYLIWRREEDKIEFTNQKTEDIVAQIEAYIEKCTDDNQCRTLTPALFYKEHTS